MSATDVPPQRHFVDVWNPSIASDAMTAHLTVLLEDARRTRGTEEAPYVWWARSTPATLTRVQPS